MQGDHTGVHMAHSPPQSNHVPLEQVSNSFWDGQAQPLTLESTNVPDSFYCFFTPTSKGLFIRLRGQRRAQLIIIIIKQQICHTHTCCHCRAEVDHLTTRGFNCCQSEGHHLQHSALNDIVHQALSSANVRSRLEPAGISCSDGKRLDSISLVPWERGRLLSSLECYLLW